MRGSEEYTNTVTSYGKLKWASCERRTIFTVVLFIFPVLTSGFKVQCPTTMHRSYRSKSLCNDTDHSYYCLFDINTGGYRENCLIFPATDTKGFRKVFADNLDGIECAPETYQPFKYWTNESSDCVYQKSLCDSEGQVVHDDGNNEVDQQCRCDYRLGYGYVFKPKDGCKCVPSQEDCSCYKIFCPKGKLLTPDYECRSTDSWKTKFNCTEISVGPIITEPPIVLIKDKSEESGTKASSKLEVTCVAVLTGLILLIGTTALVRTASINDKKDTGGMQNIFINAPPEDIPLNIIELQKYEVDKWKQQLKMFVQTRASNAVLDSMKKNQCVMLTGSLGCGKTVTAYHVALELVKSEGYDLLLVLDPNDVIRYSKANGKQLLFIDDIFGKHTVDESNKDWWVKQNKRIESILSRNKDLKILGTCRSYIFNFLYHRYLTLFFEMSFLSEDLCLTVKEAQEIGNIYIGNHIDEIGDEIVMAFDFFPALCCNFNIDGRLEELLNPCKYVTSFIEVLLKRLDPSFLLFSLMVAFGNSIRMEIFCNEKHKNDETLHCLSHEIGYPTVPSQKVLFECIVSLKGSFVVEVKNAYCFKSEKLLNVITQCISKYIMRSLLQFGKQSVLRDRFALESLGENRVPTKSVLIPQRYEHLYFDRMLMDIKSGFFWDVFLDTNNYFPEFRKILIEYLQKRLTYKDYKKDTNNSTVLHAVADQGYDDYSEYFASLNKSMINSTDNCDRTPLHLAAKKGHKSVVEVLIRKNAFFDATNKEGYTPLHLACADGHVDTVIVLLSNKAAVRQNPSNLTTALHLVCKSGHKVLAEKLVDSKAEINVKDKSGFTPLHCASMSGYIEICSLLLRPNYHANINLQDYKGRTALFHACEKNKLDIVSLLLQHNANLIIDSDEKQIPLHIASEKGHKEIVEELLKSNINVNYSDIYGNSPLYLASINGHVETVKTLLLNNATVDICNNSNSLPIHVAALHGHTDVAKCLLQHGSKTNIANKAGFTPLHVACKEGHVDIVDLLLNHGASVTVRDGKKQTPLHIACQKQLGNIAETLLNHGAPVTLEDDQKQTPLHIASFNGNELLVKLLCTPEKDRNVEIDTYDIYGRSPLFIACEKGHTQIVQMILKLGADTNTKNKDGLPLLHIACQEGFADIVQLLLDHKANANITDSDLWTPLFVACKEIKLDISNILIKANADVNQANKDGDTPLHQASASGNELITNLLVTGGADVNRTNKCGETPLWKCVINGHQIVARYLINHGADTEVCNRFGTPLKNHVKGKNNIELYELLSSKESETAL